MTNSVVLRHFMTDGFRLANTSPEAGRGPGRTSEDCTSFTRPSWGASGD